MLKLLTKSMIIYFQSTTKQKADHSTYSPRSL